MAFEMLKWRGSWTGILGFFSPTPTVLLHRKAPGQNSGGDLAWGKLGGSTCVAPHLSYGYELKRQAGGASGPALVRTRAWTSAERSTAGPVSAVRVAARVLERASN